MWIPLRLWNSELSRKTPRRNAINIETCRRDSIVRFRNYILINRNGENWVRAFIPPKWLPSARTYICATKCERNIEKYSWDCELSGANISACKILINYKHMNFGSTLMVNNKSFIPLNTALPLTKRQAIAWTFYSLVIYIYIHIYITKWKSVVIFKDSVLIWKRKTLEIRA